MTRPAHHQAAPEHVRQHRLGDHDLDDRIVVITGATGGLGSALAKACAASGATVVLAGRTLKKLEALYDTLEAMERAQPAIVPLAQDTASAHDYQQIADTLGQEFGRVDALVHTAAELGKLTPLASVEPPDWDRLFTVNLTSARLLTVACLPLLERSSHASVVFTLDHKPGAYWGAYGVSKSALDALAHMLAEETEGRRDEAGRPRVAINAMDPGAMRTALRRRAFAGELETESPRPEDRLGPFLGLIHRDDPALTGAAWYWPDTD